MFPQVNIFEEDPKRRGEQEASNTLILFRLPPNSQSVGYSTSNIEAYGSNFTAPLITRKEEVLDIVNSAVQRAIFFMPKGED